MTSSRVGVIFAMDVDGKPTIAFEAKNFREALELCKEEWLHVDLSVLKSNGVPLWKVGGKLTVRKATESEKWIYEEADQSVQAPNDLVLAYLIELDGTGRSPAKRLG
jgi:hypothetical protein